MPDDSLGLPAGGPPEPEGREADVPDLHAAVLREPAEPAEGREPPPWWLWAGVVVSLFAGGYYLGRHSGPFAPVAHVGHFGPGSETAAETSRPSVDGAKVYATRCASCHQPDGRGVPGSLPPLAGSTWVTGDPGRLIRIVAYGMEGPLVVAGQTYQGVMPAWKDQLSVDELAAVITHERRMGGNQAAAVSPADVQRVLAATGEHKPFRAQELDGGQP